MTEFEKLNDWKKLLALQQPEWPDTETFNNLILQISNLPALVYAGETRSLLEELSSVSRGDSFLLQAGDCAEEFSSCNGPQIHDLLKIILQMAIVIAYSGEKKVVKIGRLAGQYAKPRSSNIETINGISLPSYRGDMVNGIEFTKKSRIPSPKRLVEGYFRSAATLNLVRAFTKGGYGSLDKVASWNEVGNKSNILSKEYNKIVKEINKAIKFISLQNLDPNLPQLNEVNFYTSHEALLLPYEEALTRVDTTTGDWYNTSAHFLWIGERTRQINGAHVEFLRGVGNPIGIKIGPTINIEDIPVLCQKLNPENLSGKITLITRMGTKYIEKVLPKVIDVVQKNNLNVVWCCDPMHGNTVIRNNFKTRLFDDILMEINSFWKTHKELGTIPGGVHLELTGKLVTECIGSSSQLSSKDLGINYSTNCDPRLNANQALELAFKIAEIIKV